MLGDSSALRSSLSRKDPTAAVAAPESGGGGDGSGGGSINSDEDNFRGGGGDRLSFGGNRWPRQETIALLQIRSEMDVAFRDASVKGPLWDEVSRKHAALGYQRSAKKCKEKFENVYKYHRRTKEDRTGKSEGKTYRFSDQLSALENQPPTPGSTSTTSTPHHQPPRHHPPTTMAAAAATLSAMPTSTTIPLPLPPQPPPQQPPPMTDNPTHLPHHSTFPSSFPTASTDLPSNSTSSSTSSDEELEGRAKRKRKRKWKDFFERLMKDVVHKQEDLQRRFLEAIEKREHERMVREEAWRMQEMARINREREILAQEKTIAAAKDSAVVSFLQKVSEQQQNQSQNSQPGQAQCNFNNSLLLPLPPLPVLPPPPPPHQTAAPPPPPPQSLDIVRNNGEMMTPGRSLSRWPKVEIEALIQLRTNLDAKYQENGPKGPLWEEISGQMKKLGYNRNSKRCKEKWENINKYFKKVKESNKTRPEDSKTCPYFHLLDNLYRERKAGGGTDSSGPNFRPENTVPLMVRPEQQWPPQQQQEGDLQDRQDKENVGDEDDEDDDADEEEEEEDDGNYEIMGNKPAPVGPRAE